MIAATSTAAALSVRVRPLTASERDLIERVFDGLSPRSRLLRFLTPMPRLPRRTLDVLSAIDGTNHAAWVAMHGEEPIGVVRWVRDSDDPRKADIAIEVVDAQQGRGIGRRLADAALAGAAERGVERLTYDMDPSNAAALRLVDGYRTRMRYEDGLLTGEIATPPPPRRRFASASRRRTGHDSPRCRT